LPRNVERRVLIVRVEADSPMMEAIKLHELSQMQSYLLDGVRVEA